MKVGRYEVFFQVDRLADPYLKDVISYRAVPDDQLPVAIVPSLVMSSMKIYGDRKFACVEIRAPDSFSAARKVHEQLGLASSVSVLSAWHFDLPLPTVYVAYSSRRKMGRAYEMSTVDSGSSVRIAPSQARGTKQSKSDANVINDYFSSKSKERLHNSISSVHGALQESSYDSRLISIWSSFEAFLSSPPANAVRILHYVELISPCILSAYCERAMIYVYNAIVIGNRSEFIKILDRIEGIEDDNRLLQFIALLLVEDNDDLYQELLRLIASNPILSYRIIQLRDKFLTPENYINSLNGHKDRVEWQLHRIYRARNQLVHAGRAPPYLEALTVNAFEYYRNAVREIMLRAKRIGRESDIDTVVESVGLAFKGHMSYVLELKSARKFSVKSIHRAFRPYS